MPRNLVGVLAVGVLVAQVVFAQAPQGDGPTLQPLWTLARDFASPESAYYHAGSNAIFVSSINGQILEKDGNGYISRLSPDGKMVSAKWVTGLNAPKGIRSIGGTLWVTDIDEVVSIDIASAKITGRVKVDGAQFLNDLATAPDRTIYASDSNLARIYAVKDGKSSVFVEGADQVDVPNGLHVSADALRLSQALGNLVDNALRYGEGEIVLGARSASGGVEFDTSDQGAGFDPDIAGRAFERFARGDGARTRGGTGLGMAIVRAVAEAHGGWADIVAGDGTTVRLWLPDEPGVPA